MCNKALSRFVSFSALLLEVLMRRTSVLICFAVLVLLLVSCSEFVSPVAYTRYETTGSQVVFYTSHEVGTQIEVYEDASEEAELLMEFSFTRCLGRDELEDVEYTLVDVKYHPSLNVTVKYYDNSKDFYLNGTKLIPDDEVCEGVYKTYFYNEITGFNRTNPNGYINPALVNVIEYK